MCLCVIVLCGEWIAVLRGTEGACVFSTSICPDARDSASESQAAPHAAGCGVPPEGPGRAGRGTAHCSALRNDDSDLSAEAAE